MPILLTIILLLTATSGVSIAAQNSLPGDTLYPVKIKTEDVRSILSFSDESKAELESQFAEKRLEEAEELSNESKLDENTRVELEQNFEEHANRVEEHAQTLSSTDARAAADINSNLEVSLRAHDRILSRIATVKDGDTEPQINSLLIKVRSETSQAGKNKKKGEVEVGANANVQTAAEGRLTAAENKIKEVEDFIAKAQTVIGAQATADATARLQISKNLVISGKAKLTAKSYNEAFILFGQAQQTAQEAKLLVEAKRNLNIDVKLNIDSKTKTEIENDDSSSSKIQVDSKLRARIGP